MATLIGTAGAAILLLFFLLNQAHKISNDSVWYDAGNFVGSLLLVLYSYLLASWPFLILNGVWALFSLRDVINDLIKKRLS